MAASPDAVLHLAALHTLAQAGFASTSRAASVTLSGVLARYLDIVASSCTGRATLAGRSKVAAIDVVEALEDLGVGGIAELQEWTVDLDKEVSFTGGKLDELAGYLRDGLTIDDGIEAHYVPVASDEEDSEEEEDAEGEEDDAMDVDVKEEMEVKPWIPYRPRSPDMSWLPPLPSGQTVSTGIGAGAVTAVEAADAPQSVADRYRRPVAYASSQLAESHPFVAPPQLPTVPLPPAPSSFQSLLSTYEAVMVEPSIDLRQTEGRRQAFELLRLTVGNPSNFSPQDTLSQALPPPHVSPIVPSHSESYPPRLLPVNPDQDGIITTILHQIRSSYLPPPLRERLTSLRPPQAQTNDAGPILFGEAIRGADEATLARTRGKATGTEPEGFFRATWDSGPRGSDRWSRGKLPTGKKVVCSGEGETAPRESEGAKALRLKMSTAGIVDRRDSSPAAPSPAVGIKLRLGAPKQPGAATSPAAVATSPASVPVASPDRLAAQNDRSFSAPGISNSETVAARPTAGSAPPMTKTLSQGSNGVPCAPSRSVSPSKRNSMSPVKQEAMIID